MESINYAGGSPDFDEAHGHYRNNYKRIRARAIIHSHEHHARDENGKVKRHRLFSDGSYGQGLSLNGIGAPPTTAIEKRETLDKSHAFDIRPHNNPLLRDLTFQPIKATHAAEHAYAPLNTGAASFTPYDQNAANLHSQQTNRNHASGLRSTEHLVAPSGRTLNDKSARINPTHGYIPTQNQYGYQHSSADHQGPNAPEPNPTSVTNISITFKSPEHERKCDQIMAQATQYHSEGNHNPSNKRNGLTPEEEKMIISISLAGLFTAGSITAYVFRGSIAALWDLLKATAPIAAEGAGAAISAAISVATAAAKKVANLTSRGINNVKTTLATLFGGANATTTSDTGENEPFNPADRDAEDAPTEGENAPAESEQAPEGGAEAKGNTEGADIEGAQNAAEIDQAQQAGNQAGEAGGESFSIDEGLASGGGGEDPSSAAGAPESGAGVGSVEGVADANAIADAKLPIVDAQFAEPSAADMEAMFAKAEKSQDASFTSQLYDYFKSNVLGYASEYSNIAGLPEVPEPITIRLPYSNQAVPISQSEFGSVEEAMNAGYIVEGGGSAIELEGGAGAGFEAARLIGGGAEGAEAVRMLEFAKV